MLVKSSSVSLAGRSPDCAQLFKPSKCIPLIQHSSIQWSMKARFTPNPGTNPRGAQKPRSSLRTPAALADALGNRKEPSLCEALRLTAVRIGVLMHTATVLIVLCCITRCQARQATAITSTMWQPKQTEKHSAHMVSLLRAHTYANLHIHRSIDRAN